jgi:hypothetical protein
MNNKLMGQCPKAETSGQVTLCVTRQATIGRKNTCHALAGCDGTKSMIKNKPEGHGSGEQNKKPCKP